VLDRGLYVAMLGIDGTGKTTMAELLTELLSAGGHAVKRLSYRGELSQARRTNTRHALQELWVESLRLLYLGVDELVPPPSYAAFEADDWERRLRDAPVAANVPAGPLAAAWLEWVGQVLLRHESVIPNLRAGVHVVDESFGLKTAFRELLLAVRLSADPAMSEEIGTAKTVLSQLFATCRPDVGLLITSPIEQAHRWRMRQKGSLGVLESMAVAGGDPGLDGFVEIQSQCDAYFREFAATAGWTVFEMDDRPPQDNFDRLLDVLRAHPVLGPLLAGQREQVGTISPTDPTGGHHR
jgi:predicted kinase